MSKQTHTPGPWKAWQRPEEQGTNYWRIRTTPNESDGDTLHGYCGEANARLITAAPEMCGLLAQVVNGYKEGDLDLQSVAREGQAILSRIRGDEK